MKIMTGILGAILLLIGTSGPAGAQTCCQYAGSCASMPGSSGLTTADCVAGAGQPATGACMPAYGVCGGTVVCCDTTCRGPESTCSMQTASDCLSLHEEAIPLAGATCSTDGSCVAECSSGCSEAGQVYCNGKCVSLAADHENCGACGTACRDDEECTDGACTPAGTASETTIPLLKFGDALICAVSGVHTSPALCGGKCSDLDDDEKNCGACGKTCGANQYCSGGECFAKNPEGAVCSTDDECQSGCDCGFVPGAFNPLGPVTTCRC